VCAIQCDMGVARTESVRIQVCHGDRRELECEKCDMGVGQS